MCSLAHHTLRRMRHTHRSSIGKTSYTDVLIICMSYYQTMEEHEESV
jgi:hypothetical protein